MKVRQLSPVILPLLAIFVLGVAKGVQAQRGYVFTVISVADSTDAVLGDTICADSNGQCTLRAAIEEANATSAGDAIIFNLPQPSVINLTLGELSVTANLEIVGPGARRLTVQRSTVVGTPNFRVFRFPVGQNRRVNIRAISIRNGNGDAGGGIFVQEGNTIALFDVAITGNIATAGGGVANFGNLSLVRTLVNSNTATNQGGGITSSGSASIIRISSSTITDNSASFGGGLDNVGTATLVNNTISRNSASSGSSSIFSNPLGTVRVMNTIIGRDIGQTVPALQGQFQSFGNNIVTNSQGSTGFTNGVNNDQVSSNNSIDPLLGSLADNGGHTDTMTLLSGSPALDNANPCVVTETCSQSLGFVNARKDQRRYVRAGFGGNPEIGACDFFQGFPPLEAGGFTFGFIGPGVSKFAGSMVVLTNARTLETRFTRIRLDGRIIFPTFNFSDDHVLEFKAKRAGLATPMVIPFEF